jgi:hypothetical protein
MSDLKGIDKLKFEKLFWMSSGYVMDFSNRTFQEFIQETINIDIYDKKYYYASGSKANLLRGFWLVESNYNVARLNDALLNYWKDIRLLRGYEISKTDENLFNECKKINEKIRSSSYINHIDAISPDSIEQDFNILAESIRESIEKNQPEAALDRLHTYIVKFVHQLCDKHKIKHDKNKPLHSFFGEYIKHLKSNNLIESEMTERILKSSISILESFNKVRNDKSLAHDNPILNFNESILIFQNISTIVKFLKSIEKNQEIKSKKIEDNNDEFPF